MSSATSHRLNPSMANNARTATRFGDFSSGSGRNNEDDRTAQGSTMGKSFGNGGSSWQTSSGIWGSALGSGAFAKRDTSRSRAVEDESYLDSKPSGSGALAESSEADPWLNRASGPWNPETTSPTLSMSHASGSASPVRHRGSNQAAATQTLSEIHNTSPYFPRPNAIGQGSSYTGKPQTQSGLDPTTGSFKNQMPMFGSLDDKENMTFNNAYELDNTSRGLKMDPRSVQNSGYLSVSGGGTPRDSSVPPSRQSENASSAASNSSAYGLTSQFSSFGHTPSNSLQFQRPSFPSQTSSQSLRNVHADIAAQTGVDLSTNFHRLSISDRDMATNPALQGAASHDLQYESVPGLGKQNSTAQVQQFNGAAPAWQADPNNLRGVSTFSPGGYTEIPFAHQFANYRDTRYTDRESISPAGSDVRRGPGSPHFYNSQPALEQHRPASRGLRQHTNNPSTDLSKLQRIHLPQQFYPQSGLYDGQYAQYPFDNYSQANYRPLAAPFGYQAMGQYSHAPTAPKAHTRDHDAGHGVRSLLLEEFRSNSKTNKRYELKDIYHHVVEFSGDQHGSRFIQQKLETANSDEKEQIFSEIQPNALQLMTDVFGNYVVQKLFEHGSQVQKRVLAEKMKNHVSELSSQTYGCRVVQKALEHVLADQQAELVRELQPDILKCVKDQNGNHVIQKAIERVPTEHIQFIIEAFKGQVHTLATHPYGCRVIQRMLEFCSDEDQASVLEELHQCAAMLITDQYGNYVTQHVISSGKPEDRSKIIKIVTAQVVTLSKHKFASNVVEKSIQYGTEEERRAIVANLTVIHSDGTVPVQLLMKDQYGNYVIQKLLLQLKGADHTAFIEALKPQLIALKKYNYGKQISAIEKHVFLNSGSSQFTGSIQPPSGPSNTNTQPLNITTTSTSPTPVLTMETSSPQSSSLPSVEGSTVEGPVRDNSTKTEVSEKEMPEVRIENV